MGIHAHDAPDPDKLVVAATGTESVLVNMADVLHRSASERTDRTGAGALSGP